MDDFVGNNAKIIIEWGQLITASIILISLFLLYLLGKNNKYFLPKGILSYMLAFVLSFVIFIGGAAFMKVTNMKPRISKVLAGLEALRSKPAPPFDFNLLSDDTKRNIGDYRGQVVLLNFWATWCAPCVKEMPELNRLHSNYNDQGLVVIALSDEDRSRLLKFDEKIPFSAIAAYSKEFDWADLKTERPNTFLIDREGIVVDYFTGGYDYEYFESKIMDYL